MPSLSVVRQKELASGELQFVLNTAIPLIQLRRTTLGACTASGLLSVKLKMAPFHGRLIIKEQNQKQLSVPLAREPCGLLLLR